MKRPFIYILLGLLLIGMIGVAFLGFFMQSMTTFAGIAYLDKNKCEDYEACMQNNYYDNCIYNYLGTGQCFCDKHYTCPTPESCEYTSQCMSGMYCASGVCSDRENDGSSCSTNIECYSNYCYNGICATYVNSDPVTPDDPNDDVILTTCEDTDGTNIYVKGLTTWFIGSLRYSESDKCINANTVNELYCWNNLKRSVAAYCGSKHYCGNGQCWPLPDPVVPDVPDPVISGPVVSDPVTPDPVEPDPDCGEGYYYGYDFVLDMDMCLPETVEFVCTKTCDSDEILNELKCLCEEKEKVCNLDCPSGGYPDYDACKCVSNPIDTNCPSGSRWDDGEEACVVEEIDPGCELTLENCGLNQEIDYKDCRCIDKIERYKEPDWIKPLIIVGSILLSVLLLMTFILLIRRFRRK